MVGGFPTALAGTSNAAGPRCTYNTWKSIRKAINGTGCNTVDLRRVGYRGVAQRVPTTLDSGDTGIPLLLAFLDDAMLSYNHLSYSYSEYAQNQLPCRYGGAAGSCQDVFIGARLHPAGYIFRYGSSLHWDQKDNVCHFIECAGDDNYYSNRQSA